MRRFLRSPHVPWAAVSLFCLMLPPLWEWPERAWNAIYGHRAIEVVGASITNPKVAIGEPLFAKIMLVQRFPCEGTVDRVWLAADGETVYKQRAPFAGVAVNGDAPVARNIRWEQPAGLRPGRYTIRSIARVRCDDHRDYTVGPANDLEFEVLPAAVKHAAGGDELAHELAQSE